MKKRKPVGMAFHWFLPRPFGAEARKSRLSPDDPLRWSHKPNQASPMFVDLLCPEDIEVEIPDEGTEVRERGGKGQGTRGCRLRGGGGGRTGALRGEEGGLHQHDLCELSARDTGAIIGMQRSNGNRTVRAIFSLGSASPPRRDRNTKFSTPTSTHRLISLLCLRWRNKL